MTVLSLDQKKPKPNSDGLINCLPASPVFSRQIRYNMTKALRDTVGSPDCLVISPISLCDQNYFHLSNFRYRD